MRAINVFPSFNNDEMDELRAKILAGVIENWRVARDTDRDHFDREYLQGKAWTRCPCWLQSSQWGDGKGFKKFKFKGHTLYIHRASCEVFNGPVLSTHLVDHLCRVRGCTQPVHLEAVTPKENTLRGANQNHLLREGGPPPVSAKEINPRFFEEPVLGEVGMEHFRRQGEERDIKRVHDTNVDPCLPMPPLGFYWEQDTLNDHRWYLNPFRAKLPITVPALTEAAQCYQPRRSISGVDMPDSRPAEPTGFQFNPSQLGPGQVAMRLIDPVEYTRTAIVPVPEYNTAVVPVQEYKQYEFGVRAPVSPVGPTNEYVQNGYVPENSSSGWLRRKLQDFGRWLNGT